MPQIAEVDFDNAYSVAAGEEPAIDTVYFDVAKHDGQWYVSAVLDCESNHSTDTLVTDDGPYGSEDDALRAGLGLAHEWMFANDYTDPADVEIDTRLHHLLPKED